MIKTHCGHVSYSYSAWPSFTRLKHGILSEVCVFRGLTHKKIILNYLKNRASESCLRQLMVWIYANGFTYYTCVLLT